MLKVLKWIPDIKEPYALFLVIRDPRTKVQYKVFAFSIIGLIIAYTLSPLDIIPDTIPVLGWMDDLILIPVVLNLIERFLPRDILRENQVKANKRIKGVIVKVVLGTLAFFALWAIILTAIIFLIIKFKGG